MESDIGTLATELANEVIRRGGAPSSTLDPVSSSLVRIRRGVDDAGGIECLQPLTALAASPAVVVVGWAHARQGQLERHPERDSQSDYLGFRGAPERRDDLDLVVQTE